MLHVCFSWAERILPLGHARTGLDGPLAHQMYVSRARLAQARLGRTSGAFVRHNKKSRESFG